MNKTQGWRLAETVSASDLAEVVGVSRSYVARLCRDGKIPAEKVANAVWVIQRADAIVWIEGRVAAMAL